MSMAPLDRNDIEFNNELMAAHLSRLLHIINDRNAETPDAYLDPSGNSVVMPDNNEPNFDSLFSKGTYAGDAVMSDAMPLDLLDFLLGS